MEFLNDPQFLYLMGVLWLINGSALVDTKHIGSYMDEAHMTGNIMALGSWLVGIGHIAYAFYV